jgi:5-methyltetrahydropteroyltriglutamate--homocysteine methyltransferase
MTGFGGHWGGRATSAVIRPKKRWAGRRRARARFPASGTFEGDEVTYIDKEAIDSECRDLNAALGEQPGAYLETFMSSPSPGIVASALKNEYYDTLEAYLAALGKALQVEYEAIVSHGFILQVDAPDLALERHVTYKDQPLKKFQEFVEMVIATINRSLVNVQLTSACLLGQFGIAHDSDVALADICRSSKAVSRPRAALRQSAPRPRVQDLRRPSARRRPDPRCRRDRYADQLRRASGSRRRQTGARCHGRG